MPDLSGFLNLERLILCNCLNLGKMDSSIVKLKCLTYLNLKGCISLEGVPEGIGRLLNLEYWCLEQCSEITELPSEVGDLKSLLELNISDTGIQGLPDSLGKLKKLKVISSKKDKLSLLSAEEPKRRHEQLSEKLEGVNPNRKGRLSFLTTLKLSDSSDKTHGIYTIPSVIIELINLITLDLEDCNKLQQLPKLPKRLDLKPPRFLQSVLNVLDLNTLFDLLFFDGSKDLSFHTSNVMLTSLQWIRKLNKQGNLESCLGDILTPSIKLSSLSWQNKLSLLRQGVQSLIWLSSFLSVLAFGDLCSTNMWSYISSFKNSSNLWIYQYEHEKIELYELEGLRKLTLENCEPLQRVSNLSIWKNLKELGLMRCPKLVELQNLGGFESLEKLQVKLCQSIERLGGLSNLRKLNILIIEECGALKDVEGLDELDSLRSLKMWNCSMLKHLTDVSNTKIPDGCEVIIWKCGGLHDFGHLGHDLPYKHYKEVVLGTADWVSGSDLAKRPGKMSDMELKASANLEESIEKIKDEAGWQPVDTETSDRNYAIASVQKLVGIDDRAKQMTDLLEMEVNDGVRIIGIYGTDGIGKTTLAKTIYDNISSCFDSCSFLAEVDETTQNSRGIQFLQAKLTSDILGRDCEDPSFDETIEIFLDIFREMKVLIVVDDVDKQSHLHAIVGDQLHWFGPGSRIIVTSQNKEILKEYDREKARTYTVGALDDGQVFELFCKHAFGMQSSIPDYDRLANRIVKATEKLPLAVEVVGSFLRGKSIQEWEKMEKSMKQFMRSQKTTVGLEEILDICYKELDQQQNDMFLDIACFISGVDARIASYMWPNCYASSGCVLMPLAKIGENNELQMHRLLRCLGKRILNREGSGDPIDRKFYIQDIVPKAISREKGMENVQALCFDFTAGDFQSMPDIRFLKLDNAKVSGNFEGAFASLRWLCWQRCPLDFSAENFLLTELVILDLSWSKITEEWGGWSEIKMKKLKVLNLTGCSDLLFTPDFSGYEYLEILILERCSHLVKLDPSIGNLKHLVYLNLKFCSQLNWLPAELGCATALKELFIDGTSVRQIPISIGNLKQLEILSGLNCFPLTHLPSSICYLTALSELSLKGAKISKLPSSLGKLQKLRRLSLRDCRCLKKLPYSIGEIGSLEELDISATSVSELRDSIRNLKSLKVLRMDSSFIRAFPGEIGNLTKLEELHASWCRSLKGAIPSDIEGLHSLRSLTLGHSSISSLPPEISTIPGLHTLDLIQCDEIEELPKLPPSLICLRVSSKKMKAIPLLEDLKELEELCLSDWEREARQPPSNLPMAESNVKRMIGKQSFSISFPKLRKLELSLSQVVKLKFGLTDVPPLKRLKTLHLPGLSRRDVSELPKTLSVFRLYHSAIEEIEGLEGLEALKRLDISNCKIQNLNGIGQITSLRSLILSDCDYLSLPDLSNLKSLKVLEIRRCKMIGQIEGLEKLTSLEKLNISECPAENSVQVQNALKHGLPPC
ncbi:hypothetical protein ACJRO7_015353 [Eucalyptus globulus]|uniref:AAA+ ATPase domain-containing protein n=1 Tax=Eucalyptus globulus TaxID=34317 RepID=A0ABD3L8V7_EUCGL